MKKTTAVSVAGLILGVVGARYLFVGSWMILIPWAIIGLAIGFLGSKNESVINGVAYGFVLSFTFLIAGYSGTSSLSSRLPFFAVLGALGAIGGVIVSFMGHVVRTKTLSRSSHVKKPQ